MLKKYLKPSFCITGLLIIFLIFILANQVWEHNKMLQSAEKDVELRAKELAHQIRMAIMQIVELAEKAGENVYPHIEALNQAGSIDVRIIRSAAINEEYGFKVGEQPQTEIEKQALSDGIERSERSGEFFIHILPLKTGEFCQKCHHVPEDLSKPVPVGYTIGLIKVNIPTTHLKHMLDGFQSHNIRTAVGLIVFFLVFGFGIISVFQNLWESKSRLNNITSSAKDAIFMVNSDLKISFWNKAAERIFGYSAEQAAGKNLHQLIVCQKFHDDFENNFKNILKAGEGKITGKTLELTCQKKDGTEFAGEYSISAFKVKSKWHAIGIVRDISERKGFEEEMKRRNLELEKASSALIRQEKLASLGILSAGVAHEILNPLNIMSTIINVMQMEELPEEINKNLDEVMNQIKRATKITNNLRMFASQKAPEITPVNVNELFNKTATLIEHDLSLDNILIERDFDKNLPVIDADEDQLAQIFLNLLTNARDAMIGRAKNLIKIKTRTLDDKIEIRFTDNGPGVPENIKNQIFDPFFTTKDPNQGTGLGLSVVHSNVDRHGGCVSVESKEGEGTTFVIRLPLKCEV